MHGLCLKSLTLEYSEQNPKKSSESKVVGFVEPMIFSIATSTSNTEISGNECISIVVSTLVWVGIVVIGAVVSIRVAD